MYERKFSENVEDKTDTERRKKWGERGITWWIRRLRDDKRKKTGREMKYMLPDNQAGFIKEVVLILCTY